MSKHLSEINGIDIYEEDFNLIDHSWFNDNLINYEIQNMIQEKDCEKILIIDAVQFILLKFQPIEDLLDCLDGKKYKHIISVINDVDNNDKPGGGEHWSLAYFNINEKKCFYYDSVGYKSLFVIKDIVEKMSKYFDIQFKTVVGKCYQQQNGIDCGPCVLINIHALQSLIFNNKNSFGELQNEFTPIEMRNKIKQRILKDVEKNK